MGKVFFDLPFGHGQQSCQFMRGAHGSRQDLHEVLARSQPRWQHVALAGVVLH
jgi:hypothetical protein